MSGQEVAGGICFGIGCFLASAGGIGGGGVLVSIGLVVFEWEYTQAVVLALVAVFGNLLAQQAINYKKPHMTVLTRPLIYWDSVRLLSPALLGGSSIGKIVEKILPDSVKKSIAFVVLGLVTIKTFFKAVSLHRLENQQITNGKAVDNDRDHEKDAVHNAMFPNDDPQQKSVTLTELSTVKRASSRYIEYPRGQSIDEEVRDRVSVAKMSFDGEGGNT